MRRWFLLVCWSGLLCVGVVAEEKKGPTRRAPLPSFSRSQADAVFFPNVFARLNGERPSSPDVVATNPSAGAAEPAGAGSDQPFTWSKIISPTTIEDEVKAIKLRVDQSLTTRSDFAGRGHRLVRREYTILAMLFAIISDYDGNVRWKDNSRVALHQFVRTASNAKAGGNANVYKEVKLRQQELDDLLRGSRLAGEEASLEDWSEVADRVPLMQRLESSHQGQLTPWTASKDAFSENVESILHEAQMTVAMAEALTREGMEDGDDEDYAGFAIRMKDAALQIVAAVKLDNQELARRAAGEITKACSECHESYR